MIQLGELQMKFGLSHLKNGFLILMLFLLCSDFSFGQLVNIESKRMQTDSIRFVFNGDLSFNYTNNDGAYIYKVKNNITSQFKSKDLNKIFLLIGDFGLIRSEEKDFENSWFLHLRYNQEISNLFRLEAFVQGQNNKILDVNGRYLVGVGSRFKLISKNNFRMYWGNAYMYEYEISDFLDEQFENHRFSSYLSFSVEVPNSSLSVSNTAYFQPLFKDFSDFRVLEQLKVNVAINKKLSMFALLDYYYDSNTPRDRKQFSTQSSVGLGLNL